MFIVEGRGLGGLIDNDITTASTTKLQVNYFIFEKRKCDYVHVRASQEDFFVPLSGSMSTLEQLTSHSQRAVNAI